MITIISTPNTPIKAFTPTLFEVVSDDPTIERMQGTFIGTVGNTSVTGLSITLSAQVTLGSTGSFIFDMQEYVRDNLYYDIQTPALPVEPILADNSLFNIRIQQYTELLDNNGQLVNGATLTDSSDVFQFLNAVRQVADSELLTDYVMDGVNIRKFLTNSPRTIDIRSGESYVLSVFSTTTSINALSVNFRDASGASISNQVITFGTPREGRYDIPVGLANLVAEGVSIPADAFDYRISIGQQSGSYTRHSEFFVFKIVDECIEDSLRVHFLNKLGGFDSYTFTGVTKEQVNTTSSQYERNLGTTYNTQSRGRQTQYRNALTSYVATSDILSRADSEWLTELTTTAVAYIEQGGKLVAVTINDGRFLVFDSLKLNQLQMTFTLSNDNRNQRL